MINHTKKPDLMTLNYMKYLRIMMITVGAWPSDIMASRPRRPPFYSIYLMHQTTALITGQFIFILKRFQMLTFFDLGDVYIALSLSFLVMFRAVLSCLTTYGTIFHDFVTKFHLMHFKHKSEFSEMMYQKTNQISLYFTQFMIWLSISGVVSFNITPLYRNYRLGVFHREPPANVSAEFSVHYQFPGFLQEDHYLPSTLANWYISYICAFLVCSMDLALCLMVVQIIGHIRVLADRLENFPKPTKMNEFHGLRKRDNKKLIMVEVVNNFDDQENETIKILIAECVQHHRFIVSFTDDISSFFGPMLAFNYMFHMVSISLLFVECMEGEDALVRYGPLTMMTLGQLSQLSITFEIVGSESEKLIDQVYAVPWESMSVSNQKTMGFFLKRVQKTIRVTAMGMTSVGVQTMGGILKTTLSYCAFLRSLS